MVRNNSNVIEQYDLGIAAIFSDKFKQLEHKLLMHILVKKKCIHMNKIIKDRFVQVHFDRMD